VVSKAVILPFAYIVAWFCVLLFFVIPSTVVIPPYDMMWPGSPTIVPIVPATALGNIEVTLFFFPFTVPVLIFALFFFVALLLEWNIKWWR